MAALFDMAEGRKYRRNKNMSVRVPSDRRQRLELIANEKGWLISEMVRRMIDNYIEEYDKLPKGKQTHFSFTG